MRRGLGLLVAVALARNSPAAPSRIDEHIKVDQFGYRPNDVKVAVVSDPQVGFNAPAPFQPAANLEVRRWDDDAVAFQGPAVAWRGGAVDEASGDRAWWLDFSALTAPGAYYVWDPGSAVGSGRFEVAEDVYRALLRQAVRTYFYQRCGSEKPAALAAEEWEDGACHVGPEQDRDCRSVLDPTPATSLDLAGGWHDAGDYQKYVNNADDAVHRLLYAYEESPEAWGDDFAIPESDNCVPDLLDEVKWELDWLLKMQLPDGSVLHKVSMVVNQGGSSPPSVDTHVRRYGPPTASATLSACGAFAHAARVYRSLDDPGLGSYAATLEAAARGAWAWLLAHAGEVPSAYDNAGFDGLDAKEDEPWRQQANQVCAAAHLFLLSGERAFSDYVDANYANPEMSLFKWPYASPFESIAQDCLLDYARDSRSTPAVAAAVRGAYAESLRFNHLPHSVDGDDPYLAFLDAASGEYTWGSNRTKSAEAVMQLSMVRDGLDPAHAAAYAAAAGGYLHYLHGVNPLGLVFLANTGALGAERSAREFYHQWFADGTKWDQDPAPGYVTGGPNPFYAPSPAYVGPRLAPPMDQPAQKSYRDWNVGYPESSWQVTENDIDNQAAYVRLLGAYVPAVARSAASPGNGLRAVKAESAVMLSWSPAPRATGYEVRRCDAAAGSCVPSAYAFPVTTSYSDAGAAPAPALWYQVAATNGCGSTP